MVMGTGGMVGGYGDGNRRYGGGWGGYGNGNERYGGGVR